VEVAATRAIDVEAVTDLVAAAGHAVVGRRLGRPPIDHAADAVVWDAGDLESPQITWTGLLSANRPHAAIILLDSFPRSETAAAAIRMGATAVLSRPASLESLSGILLDVAPQSSGIRG
jgi:DNA-binding NarL/FixJ family response regulator